MKSKLRVPKGKDVVSMSVTGHTYVRLLDEDGQQTFRFQSSGKHVTAVVKPGRYTIETDGKVVKLELASLEPRFRTGRRFDSSKPPLLKG